MPKLVLTLDEETFSLITYEFGNSRQQDTNLHNVRNQIVAADDIPPYRRFSFDVAGVSRSHADDFLDFIHKTVGKKITVEDSEYNRGYKGFIESPEVSRHHVDECKDTISFILNSIEENSLGS